MTTKYSKKFFSESAQKGQDKMRQELGEDKYLEMKRKYGKKGGRPRGKVDIITE